jgi:hypothetical protein
MATSTSLKSRRSGYEVGLAVDLDEDPDLAAVYVRSDDAFGATLEAFRGCGKTLFTQKGHGLFDTPLSGGACSPEAGRLFLSSLCCCEISNPNPLNSSMLKAAVWGRPHCRSTVGGPLMVENKDFQHAALKAL